MKCTTTVWALIAAIGVSYLVTGLALGVRELALPLARELELTLTNRTVYLAGVPEAILFAVAIALGGTAAAFVARRAGGGRSVALYLAFVGLEAALLIADAIAREQRLRGADCCIVASVADMPLAMAAMMLPTAVGVPIGAAAARSRAAQPGANTFLEAAGAYASAGAAATVIALGMPVSALVFAPYATVQLGSVPHALTVGLQVGAAAIVFALRGAGTAPRVLTAFAAMGLAGVAHFDLLEIWFTLFLDHKYVPVSLVVVPVASALLGIIAIRALRWLLESRADAGRPSGPAQRPAR